MTYLGFDVLPITHNMREALAESFGRRGQLLDPGTGRRVFDDQAGVPLPTRTLQWTCFDRAAVDVLRAFLDARKGRVVPFWAPTCCWDLRLVADAAPGLDLDIARVGYGDYVFTPDGARRDLAIFPRGGAMLLRRVAFVGGLDAATERVTLDATTGASLAAGATVISFLVLCRLADDMTEIQWSSPSMCEASLQFVELPREVPA